MPRRLRGCMGSFWDPSFAVTLQQAAFPTLGVDLAWRLHLTGLFIVIEGRLEMTIARRARSWNRARPPRSPAASRIRSATRPGTGRGPCSSACREESTTTSAGSPPATPHSLRRPPCESASTPSTSGRLSGDGPHQSQPTSPFGLAASWFNSARARPVRSVRPVARNP
jgi:hypothetical protein